MARKASEAMSAARRGPREQVGALCFRRKSGVLQVLMITSRQTHRWIIPKGWTGRGLDPHQAAEREAWEEAGVVSARVGRVPLGSYRYRKLVAGGSDLPCRIAVYPVEVGKLARDFPERSVRRRCWMRPARAARLVAEPGLRRLFRRL